MGQNCYLEGGVPRQTKQRLLRKPGKRLDQIIAVADANFGGDLVILPCGVQEHDEQVELA